MRLSGDRTKADTLARTKNEVRNIKRFALIALRRGIVTVYGTTSEASLITWDFALGSSTPSTSFGSGYTLGYTFTDPGSGITVDRHGLGTHRE